jgi:hypothetical protein
MRKFSAFFNTLLLPFVLISCTKDPPPGPEPDPNIKFSASLTGNQEIPANTSLATASTFATFNINTKLLATFTTYSNFTGTPMGNIHKGAIGVNGPIIFPFTSLGAPQVLTPLTAAQEADLLANQYYINIQSTDYPDGEIRGQLLKQ